MRSVSHPEKESFNECLVRCYRQAEPARRLINLQQVPTLILQAEASYHAGYDHCSVRFLKQAGVNVDFIKLEEVGVRGNGHMMMLEGNNQEDRESHDRLAAEERQVNASFARRDRITHSW
jgi:pimeloyl-ACP methyl ester carboxylesterase